MSLQYAQIAQRVFNTPLAYDQRKAEAFLHGLGGRIAGDTVVVTNPVGAVEHTAFESGRPLAGKVSRGMERAFSDRGLAPFPVIDGVAIITIEGSLVHKGAWIGSNSGETSYQGLITQVSIARRAPAVKGVVFEVDSYGGEVNGMFETMEAISQLSKEKPTLSVLTDYAYSAGYALASQARSIVLPEFGGAGSVGVIILHADYSEMLRNEGVKVTIIRSGQKKALGNPYEGLPDDVAEKWQTVADAMRDKFAAVVARGRSNRISKARALSTEAEVYTANEAVALGLADAVGDPIAAFDAFVKEVNRK